jgi:hypothetical protein
MHIFGTVLSVAQYVMLKRRLEWCIVENSSYGKKDKVVPVLE